MSVFMPMYDVTYRRKRDKPEGNKKYFWPKLGVAFQSPDGNITVKLDSLPLPSEWDGELILFKHRAAAEPDATSAERDR